MTGAIVLEEKSPYGPGDIQGKDAIVAYLESSIR